MTIRPAPTTIGCGPRPPARFTDLPWCRASSDRWLAGCRRPPAGLLVLLAQLRPMLPDDAVGFARGDGWPRLAAAQRAQLLASLGDCALAAAGRAAAAGYLRGAGGDLG